MQSSALDFQSVYDAFHDRIVRYLARLAGDMDAEDLAQEVFVKVSRSLGEFRGECQLSTWIYRIATNTAIDRLRSPVFQMAGAALPLDEEEASSICLTDPGSLPDQEVMRKEMYDCFGSFVHELPPPYRAVVILSELEELPDREIADILGLSLEAVKMRLHRGRALLFQRLQQHCKAEDWL